MRKDKELDAAKFRNGSNHFRTLSEEVCHNSETFNNYRSLVNTQSRCLSRREHNLRVISSSDMGQDTYWICNQSTLFLFPSSISSVLLIARFLPEESILELAFDPILTNPLPLCPDRNPGPL